MSRTTFASAEANIVVCTDGYFDVYPPIARTDSDKPAYRGVINELGGGLRGPDERLAIRPTSALLADAVAAWSRTHGAAAVRGEMGLGRHGVEGVAGKPAAADAAKPAAASAKPAPASAKPAAANAKSAAANAKSAAAEPAKSKKKG